VIPEPKYKIGKYPFGEILEKFFHNEDQLADSEWSYQMIKAGNRYAFWYGEDEICKLDQLQKAEHLALSKSSDYS
jgi:hypothetical protein